MEKKILFLEGPIQTGKSTLIRQVLGEHLKECGGFTSQRLIAPDGVTLGFRIGAAAVTPPAAADRGITEDTFKYFCPDGTTYKNQSVFDTAGVRLLQAPSSCPLILLDEIGGSELLCETFRSALYDTLSGRIPCLGVLKQTADARRLERSYDNQPVAEANLRLRRRITEELGGNILRYDRFGSDECTSDVIRTVSRFIKSIRFCT
ncbi:MAG: hypothetical protein IJ109_05445 [Firmicutes bacterium]|nr:hypothetical protein [Bacillota bacterium]